jgi:tRNA splicing ligase
MEELMKSVQKILKGFYKTLTDLERLSEVKQREAEAIYDQVVELEALALEASNERRRASMVADRLRELVTVSDVSS